MHTRVSGIPCVIKVTHYSKGYPSRVNKEVDFCYEGEDDEIEYAICDRNGRPAPWLEAKATQKDHDRIITELLSK